ncbi:MAG: hypothetical protein HeimC2_22610 [Candidatus Heimdallarchaeota archaeon LC_2]|nr:MAG: hypothetical protein HeimC2_22610 [Candidatus Heimdallarchaeota archaeon LC_2]
MEKEEALKTVLMKLLHAIHSGDVDTYNKLATEDLTCFEPETYGNPVDGLAFHQFFIENSNQKGKYHLELIRPVIRIISDNVAYASYTLLINRFEDSEFKINSANETRIFKLISNEWKMIHFHRS